MRVEYSLFIEYKAQATYKPPPLKRDSALIIGLMLLITINPYALLIIALAKNTPNLL